MTKKEFILKAISPYYKDRSICGYNEEVNKCMYLTPEGNKCVAVQFMLRPSEFGEATIFTILKDKDQKDVFIPEVVDILEAIEWNDLQCVHDNLATGEFEVALRYLSNLHITIEELENYIMEMLQRI